MDARSGEMKPLNIAVVGTGISGLSAAWLLSGAHQVTVFESAARAGGHSHTVDAPAGSGTVPVDTGFIVYNEPTYPNLTALFRHLDVPTKPSEMSFAVSFGKGRFEYGGSDLNSLFAQRSNIVRPRFWSMLNGLQRFYRTAPSDIARLDRDLTSLGDYLAEKGYSRAFTEDHLLPLAAAIWSAPVETLRAYPAAAFLRFCQNHGLLNFVGRPQWRTVVGGSRSYVRRLTAAFADRLRLDCPVRAIERGADGVTVVDAQGRSERFDRVLMACHADQALAMLAEPSPDERSTLGAFRYEKNIAVLHADSSLMPKRRRVWSSWNYIDSKGAGPSVTYWMNRLQGIDQATPLFVTLNPHQAPRAETVIRTELYEHPVFDAGAIRAQRALWSLQGARNTWFCGAYFGAGFHEDGLQAGLAAAEALGGVRRPWTVAGESGRIHLGAPRIAAAA